MIMDIQEMGGGRMDWSDMAQDRHRRRLFVNAERTFVFRKMWGISCLAENLLASQEGLCSTELIS